MVHFLASSARSAIVALRCPACGHVQARARKKRGERYACKSCHRLFTLEEGQQQSRR
jgi:transposase-like protein